MATQTVSKTKMASDAKIINETEMATKDLDQTKVASEIGRNKSGCKNATKQMAKIENNS